MLMPRSRAAAIRRVEVVERAVVRVDAVVVGDVVAPVDVRARERRAEPDRVDTEPREVVEPARRPRADRRSRRRSNRRTSDVDLVDDSGHEARQATVGVVSRAHKLANLLGVTLPLVGLVAAVALLWNTWLHPIDIALLVAGYLLTGIGVTVGYHRLFTHRAFQTKQWLRWTFAILGSMAVEGPVLELGRRPPQAPPVLRPGRRPAQPARRRRRRLLGAAKNLFHAHVGWLFVAGGPRRDREVRTRPARRARHEDDQQAVRRLARASHCSSRRRSATRSSAPGRARSPRSSGAARSASSCSTT